MITDSKNLFDVIYKKPTTTKIRLSTSLISVTQSYKRKEISKIGFIRSSYNPAYELTKMRYNSVRYQIIQENKVKHLIDQCVIRTDSSYSTCQTDSAEESCGIVNYSDEYDPD